MTDKAESEQGIYEMAKEIRQDLDKLQKQVEKTETVKLSQGELIRILTAQDQVDNAKRKLLCQLNDVMEAVKVENFGRVKYLVEKELLPAATIVDEKQQYFFETREIRTALRDFVKSYG